MLSIRCFLFPIFCFRNAESVFIFIVRSLQLYKLKKIKKKLWKTCFGLQIGERAERRERCLVFVCAGNLFQTISSKQNRNHQIFPISCQSLSETSFFPYFIANHKNMGPRKAQPRGWAEASSFWGRTERRQLAMSLDGEIHERRGLERRLMDGNFKKQRVQLEPFFF